MSDPIKTLKLAQRAIHALVECLDAADPDNLKAFHVAEKADAAIAASLQGSEAPQSLHEAERSDKVAMHAGIVHLPAEFRDVARLANAAGLEGWEVLDVEMGINVEEAQRILLDPERDASFDLPVEIKLNYRAVPRANAASSATETTEGSGNV